jgi:hypothetical protein
VGTAFKEKPGKNRNGFCFLSQSLKLRAMASGTMKRHNGHFIRMESTMNFIKRESQKHILLILPSNNFYYLPFFNLKWETHGECLALEFLNQQLSLPHDHNFHIDRVDK